MTTAAEVRQILGRYPADAQRVVFKPSSLLASDEGLDDLAREVVALANREGGRLVLGVTEGGGFEGRIELSREEVDTAVEALLATRMLPRPRTTLEHLGGEDGELVVLRVEPRQGPPHAFARVTARGGVAGRVYYVRDADRTRPVTESQLAWMFRVAGDPAVRLETTLDLHTVTGRLRVADSVPQPRAAAHFATLLEGVSEDLADRLGADPEARAAALTELAAWAFLLELQAVLADGVPGIEVRAVPLDDLPVPATGSVFAAGGPGLRAVLDGDRARSGLAGLLGRQGPGREFRLPRGSELQVDYLSRQTKGRVTLLHEGLVVTFSARPLGGGEGLSWAADRQSTGRPLVWTRLRTGLTGSLPFPAATDDGRCLEALLQRLARALRRGWDTPGFLAAIDSRYLAHLAGPRGEAG